MRLIFDAPQLYSLSIRSKTSHSKELVVGMESESRGGIEASTERLHELVHVKILCPHRLLCC